MNRKPIVGFVFLNVEPISRVIVVSHLLKKIQGLVEIHEVTGEYDLMIKIEAKNVEKLRQLLRRIHNTRNVANIETIMSIHRVK